MEDPKKRWDGTPHRSAWQKWKDQREQLRLEAERKRSDPKLVAEAKRKAAKREAKWKRRRAKRSVFSEVTEENESGERACIRCGGTTFKTRPKLGPVVRGLVLYQPIVGVARALTSMHKVCQTCGAAYPVR